MLSKNCHDQINELIDLLHQIKPRHYCEISPVFISASIGQHMRHILELFGCLFSQYDSGIISYHHRERDFRLETEIDFAIRKIFEIQEKLSLPDKDLILMNDSDSIDQSIKTTFNRELLYNLEHCVHHQALIKLACSSMKYLNLPDTFGVAKSTINHKKIKVSI